MINDVTFTLGGLTLEVPSTPFLQKPMEQTTDVTTLDFTQYTDFVAKKNSWELNFGILTETQYNALKAVYDDQFATGTYPTFVVPFYSINTQVRMALNDKDMRQYGASVYGVQVTLTEKSGSV